MNPNDIPWIRSPGTRAPEEKYLDGHIHALAPGVDYPDTSKGLGYLRTKLWKLADGKNMRVRTRVVGGLLYIQATGPWGETRDNAQLRPTEAAAAVLGPPQPEQPAPPPQDLSPQPDPGWSEA